MSTAAFHSTNQIKYKGDINVLGGRMGYTLFLTSDPVNQNSYTGRIPQTYICDPPNNPSTFNLAQILNSNSDTTVVPGFKCFISNRSTTNSLEVRENVVSGLIVTIEPEHTAMIVAESVGSPDIWKVLFNIPLDYSNPFPSNFVYVNNTLFVDEQYGPLTSNERENFNAPYPTIASAVAASLAGDTIVIRPGNYTINSTITTNDRNFIIHDGAFITIDAGVIGFSNTSTDNFNLLGNATFILADGATALFSVTNQASRRSKRFECLDIQCSGSAGVFVFSSPLPTVPWSGLVRNNILMTGAGSGSFIFNLLRYIPHFQVNGLVSGSERCILMNGALTGSEGSLTLNVCQNLVSSATGSIIFGNSINADREYKININKVYGDSSLSDHLTLSDLNEGRVSINFAEDADILITGGMTNSACSFDHNLGTLTATSIAGGLFEPSCTFGRLGDISFTGSSSGSRVKFMGNRVNSINCASGLPSQEVYIEVCTAPTLTGSGCLATSFINFYDNSVSGTSIPFRHYNFVSCIVNNDLTLTSSIDAGRINYLDGDLVTSSTFYNNLEINRLVGSATVGNCNLAINTCHDQLLITDDQANVKVRAVNTNQVNTDAIVINNISDCHVVAKDVHGSISLITSDNVNLDIDRFIAFGVPPTAAIYSTTDIDDLYIRAGLIEGFPFAFSYISTNIPTADLDFNIIRNCNNGILIDADLSNRFYLHARECSTDTSTNAANTTYASILELTSNNIATQNCYLQIDRALCSQTAATTAFRLNPQMTENCTANLYVKKFDSPVATVGVELSSGGYVDMDEAILTSAAGTKMFSITSETGNTIIKGRYRNDTGVVNDGIVFENTLTGIANIATKQCMFYNSGNSVNNVSAFAANIQNEDRFVSPVGTAGVVNFVIAALNNTAIAGLTF